VPKIVREVVFGGDDTALKAIAAGSRPFELIGDYVLLNVRNAGSKPVQLIWGGIAWKNVPKGSPLEVDEGTVDLRHRSPKFTSGYTLAPSRSTEFEVTSTYRLNQNLAWVGVEAVLDGGEHQTFKVPARQLRRLVREYERYRRQLGPILIGRR
jgi:hypothetical protein